MEKMHTAESANRFFVLTGGPSSGKSTLIDALQHSGYARSVEAGRAIIEDQMSIAGRALPWEDRLLFSELMLSWEMRSYGMAQHQKGPVFFDRGVLDVLGYLRLIGQPVPQYMEKAAEIARYNRRVFVAPPWKEIFHQDSERKQEFEEAGRTYDALVTTYAAHGYELVELPRAPIEERLRFVLRNIGAAVRG
jgi:predicted ATPase